MNPEIERNLGEQPIAEIMREHNLKAHDLVAISPVEMTHKMVARACKGRHLALGPDLPKCPTRHSALLGVCFSQTMVTPSLVSV